MYSGEGCDLAGIMQVLADSMMLWLSTCKLIYERRVKSSMVTQRDCAYMVRVEKSRIRGYSRIVVLRKFFNEHLGFTSELLAAVFN